MLQLLYTSSVSVCAELKNERPWYAPEPYRILLDGEPAGRGETNVVSLFGLKPSTEYTLTVETEGGAAETLPFRTKEEACALDVRAFGAKGDGETDDTAAIQRAIQFLPRKGRLVFPAGTYVTAPLALKSHITLDFQEGAVLLGTPDRSRYPILPGTVRDLDTGEDVHFGAFEGQAVPMYQALLTGEYCWDVALIGPGTVDGNGGAAGFWRGPASCS